MCKRKMAEELQHSACCTWLSPQGVLTVWVKKPVDGIYRRMSEHKVYVCLKTSVKSISGLKGKRRRKTKKRKKVVI